MQCRSSSLIISFLFAVLFWSTAPAQTPFAITVVRTSENATSTTGELFVNGAFVAHTLELPWRNNTSYVSSIPAGTYSARLRYDHNDRWRLELLNVPNRTNVQLHIGNYPSEIAGCVLLGNEVFNRDNRLAGSSAAYNRLRNAFYGSPNPNSTPDRDISVTIRYTTARTQLTTPGGTTWLYDNASRWLQGPEKLENWEYRRDLQYIYIKYRGPNFYFRFPIHGGEMQYSSNANGPWENGEYIYSRVN